MAGFSEYAKDTVSARAKLEESADQSAKFLKTLSQDDIDRFASLAPGYDAAAGRWGDCSLWIVSAVNRAVKAGRAPVDEIWKYAAAIRADVLAFTEYRKEMGGRIDAFRSFKELHDAAAPYIGPDGEPVPKAVTSKLSNRARTALSRMRASGMEKVYEDARFLVVSPQSLKANRSMAQVGKWCHTGNAESGTSDADYYWTEYTSYGPLYYLMDKAAGFVLCMSFARQREVRNQFDVLPYRKELGSEEWTVAVDNKEVKGDAALKYDCNDRDWESFFKWLDPEGGVDRAVRMFEQEYDKRQSELYKKAFDEEYGDVRGSVKDGVLELSDDEAAKSFARMLKAGLVEMPDAEEYQEGGDHEFDDFEEDWDRAEQVNAQKRRQFEFVQPSITALFAKIKAIRPGAYAKRLFYGTQYAGELPAIDLAGAKSCVDMFAESSTKFVPEFLNTQDVEDVSGMFRNSAVEKAGRLSFPSATKVASMFMNCGKLKEIERLSIPMAKDDVRNVVPTSIGRIGVLDIRSCSRPLSVFQRTYGRSDGNCAVEKLMFDSERFAGFSTWGLSDGLRDVFWRVAEETRGRVIGQKKSVGLDSPAKDSQPQVPFYSKWLDKIDMRAAPHDSVVKALDQFVSYDFEKLGIPVPDLVFSEKQWNDEVSGPDLKRITAGPDRRVDERISGKIKVVSHDGSEHSVKDSDITQKVEGKDLTFDKDGWLLVLSPSDARYAASYHGELDKVDITKFWDNASYDYSFELWVKNYLRDTIDDYSVDDDGHVDSDEHTEMPKIRMTRGQWMHRNDNGPVFGHAENLKYRYGAECGKDDDPPDFVVIQDEPKSISEAVASDEFVNDCFSAMRRLGM